MKIVRIIGIAGRILVAIGVLLLFYTTYLLWGTSVETRQTQDKLTQQLAEKAEKAPTSTGEILPARPATEVKAGDGLWEIVIPKIGLRKVVVQGVGVEELKKGPGHFPDAPYPGEKGNVAISGHRTTYEGPFFRLNELASGDEIFIHSTDVRYKYKVEEQVIVAPTAVEVVKDRGRDELTLTTCNPRFSASQRLIIHAAYQGPERVPPPPVPGTESADRSDTKQSAPAIPRDILAYAGVAVLAFLGAMALSARLRPAAMWSSIVIVFGAAMWTTVFPQILRLLPSNY